MTPLGSHLAAGPDAAGAERAYLTLFGAPEPGLRVRTRRVLGAVRQLAPRRVLDAGCGAGFVSIALAQSMPGAEVVGIDTSAAQVAKADDVARAARAENVSFKVASVDALDASASFDAAVVADALEYMRDPGAALLAIRGALRPGGAVVVHCRAVPTPRYLRSFKRADPFRDGRTREGYTEAELRETLTAAGFDMQSVARTFALPAELAYELADPELGWFRSRGARAAVAPLLVAVSLLPAPGAAAGLLAVARR